MTVTLRPEVQAFAESMQRLLDQHQGEKGDAWKSDDAGELMGSVERAAMRLRGAIFEYPTKTARLPRIGEAAASVGLHAMFVSDVIGALPPKSPFTDEERQRVEEQQRVIAMLTKPVEAKASTDQMMGRLRREFGVFRLDHVLPSDWGNKDHSVTAFRTDDEGRSIKTTATGASTYAEALDGLLRDFEDEERREQERSGRAHMDAGRFLERLVKEHGIKKIAFADEAEMRAVCRSNRGVYSHYYEGVGVTLADALADLLGYLERAKQQEGVN